MPFRNMSVNASAFDALMTQQKLQCANVNAVFKGVRGETMSEAVTTAFRLYAAVFFTLRNILLT